MGIDWNTTSIITNFVTWSKEYIQVDREAKYREMILPDITFIAAEI
mgnify:CR=1 FL=1